MSYVKFPYRYRDGTGCAVEAVAYFPAGDQSLPDQSRPSDIAGDARRLQAASDPADSEDEGFFVAHLVGLPQVFGFRATDTARGITVEADYPQAEPARAFEEGHDHGWHHFYVDDIEVVDDVPVNDPAHRHFVMTINWPVFRNAFERRAGAWEEPTLSEFVHGDEDKRILFADRDTDDITRVVTLEVTVDGGAAQPDEVFNRLVEAASRAVRHDPEVREAVRGIGGDLSLFDLHARFWDPAAGVDQRLRPYLQEAGVAIQRFDVDVSEHCTPADKSLLTNEAFETIDHKILQILAFPLQEEPSEDEDREVPGVYDVAVDATIQRRDWATVALDTFHDEVPVGVLEEFDFVVWDPERQCAIEEIEPNAADEPAKPYGRLLGKMGDEPSEVRRAAIHRGEPPSDPDPLAPQG